jgi:predicted DNA-binding protein
VQYRLGTTSAADEDDSECGASGDDEKDDDICKDDLVKEMTEIRELRTRIRSLESELKQRLKGLRDRANRGKANRSQIVRFISEIEGMTIVLSAPRNVVP